VALAAVLAACSEDKPKPTGGGGGSPPPAGAGTPAAGSGAAGYGYAANLGDDLDRKAGGAMARGRTWLVGTRDAGAGSWGDKAAAVGYTAMAVSALVGGTPREAVANDPAIAKGLEFLAASQKPDGSVYANAMFVNYETSAAVSAFATAKLAKYADVQKRAREFLAASQIAGDEASADYGGFPYKQGQPPDLSNMQFALTGLHDAGEAADSPVWKRSLVYLGRVQNRSESNAFAAKGKVKDETVDVVSGNDGGAVYMPGDSKAGLVKRPDGKYEAKSYGSMTYALLKCLLFAGVPVDDARVKAAVAWISRNFTLDRNPGFETAPDAAKAGQQGYYYYLFTMTRALATYEKATRKPLLVEDEAGGKHDWRREVAAKIVSLQKADGSWVNETASRWDEGDARLATSYALHALAICQGRLP
jgi:squalene-hopene/tetraprenyl-beta-curcumene cyclase